MRSSTVPLSRLRAAALAAALWGGCGLWGVSHAADIAPAALKPCRLPGVEHEAQCGQVRRALDPAAPQGRQIDVHFAVLPAMARYKQPDPLVFLAGGPGQSAIALAGVIGGQFSRLSTRRDIVLVDQRGTGRSAPLDCPAVSPVQPLRLALDDTLARARLAECRQALQRLPHGDLRHYTTAVAMADLEAVRQALGAPTINLVGGSYGTRAALEYARQFPQAVRRLVLDGVAPPDMVLPQSLGVDAQAAFDALVQHCEAEPACAARKPGLRADWAALLQALPRTATLAHPVTGREERVTFTAAGVTGIVRGALYAPILASALPQAVGEAARGRFAPLAGLATALDAGSALRLSEGQHFSVLCAEDQPRVQAAQSAAAATPSAAITAFGDAARQTYAEVCRDWPRGQVPEAFYTVGPLAAPALVLSGGLDPVTPPRHGERVARALGTRARHVVVPQAGHGVLAIACVRDAAVRFIQADRDDEAAQVRVDCARGVPRPPAWQPPGAEVAAGAAGAASTPRRTP